MARLKAALIREYEDNDEVHIEVHNPRNTEAVTLNFRGEKLAKVKVEVSNLIHVFSKGKCILLKNIDFFSSEQVSILNGDFCQYCIRIVSVRFFRSSGPTNSFLHIESFQVHLILMQLNLIAL